MKESMTTMDLDSESDLYNSGIFVLMSKIDSYAIKETVEFILRQNTEKKKQK